MKRMGWKTVFGWRSLFEGLRGVRRTRRGLLERGMGNRGEECETVVRSQSRELQEKSSVYTR